MLDSAGYARSLNIDNPKSNLTLNQIKDAFQVPIANGWLMGKNGVIVEVQKAQYSQSIKIPIAGGEISVTPSSLTIENGSSWSVTVSGANPTSAIIVDSNVTESSGSANFYWITPEIDGQTVTITAYNNASSTGQHTFTGTATLQIWFGADKINVPITVNLSIFVGP